MRRFKSGIINRIKLVLWFQIMAIWSVFSAEAGAEVVQAYVEAVKPIKADDLAMTAYQEGEQDE